MNFRSFDEFWPFYVTQHSKLSTRRWHFAGTSASALLLIYAILFNWRVLFLVPIAGYGLAWENGEGGQAAREEASLARLLVPVRLNQLGML
ncbi:hypothetical protein GIB67_027340 [Kingdonia uniflora]|uniref:DUF962 domain-containing protein n=1 Tax=Kingdonia uniflora TaxID=39325 RepID=A0A7J7MEY6_9MAGN|nr:hypothetical protein GIB67_027340 [Kingdonia uniflora]